ncbi:hypothetical protein LCGC14_2174330 [marine sediment metagenome]|uniref:Uncharacterized protein n=1 Tax=marine sediment metagenome TaxID=412755 RepID=A0A0F9EBC4_9ZZZZ
MSSDWLSLISHADFRVEHRTNGGTAAVVIFRSMASNQDEAGIEITVRRGQGTYDEGGNALPSDSIALAIFELETLVEGLEEKDWCLVGLDSIAGFSQGPLERIDADGGRYTVSCKVLTEDERGFIRQGGQLLQGLVQNHGGRMGYKLAETMALASGVFDYIHLPDTRSPF